MTRAEERSFRLLEEAAQQVRLLIKPAAYTPGAGAMKRLEDALETLARVRETKQPDEGGVPIVPEGLRDSVKPVNADGSPESVGRDAWPIT